MDVLPASKKNIILDATVLSTLMSCGRLTEFRFNYNYQSIKGKSSSMEMGSIVHTYLEYMYKARISGVSRKESHGFGMSAAESYSQSEEVTNTPPEDIKLALKTCEQYDEFYKNDPWIPLEAEVTKKKLLYQDDDIRIIWKGKLDITMDTPSGIVPVDTKTMKQRRDSISLNNQFTGQVILMDTRKMFVNKIGFQKTLPPAEKFTRTQLNFTADRLLEWQSEILPYWAYQMLSYQESGYWPPNYTHCDSKFGLCQFKDVCEANRNLRNEIIATEFKVGEPWDV